MTFNLNWARVHHLARALLRMKNHVAGRMLMASETNSTGNLDHLNPVLSVQDQSKINLHP